MQISVNKYPVQPEDFLLIFFAKQYLIFKLKDGRVIAIHKKKKTWCFITKKTICSLLRTMYFELKKQTISNSAVNTVYNLIQSLADSCKDIIESVDGILQTENSIIYDIQGSCKYVEVIENNVQIFDKNKSNYIFLKDEFPSNSNPVLPNLNVKKEELLKQLKTIFGNIEDDVLFAVYLISLFIRNINHPLLVISGEYGAAKTTFSRMVAKIVNPHSGDVVPMPKTLDDTATVIHSSYCIAFDNLSYVNRELADLLCLATTGGCYKKRKLYTDSDISSLNLHNAIVINGLNLAFPYSDLMDRAFLLELSRIPTKSRLSEEEVWKRFYSVLPDIQGCIFQILSKALSKYNNYYLSELPRLADFTRFGYAIAEEIEPGLGKVFLYQYKNNSKKSIKTAAESNPLLNTISSLMNNIDYWEGSPTDLLMALEKEFYKSTISSKLPKSFPTTSNVLSRKLNTLQNDLKILGFSLTMGRDSKRYITITKNTEV